MSQEPGRDGLEGSQPEPGPATVRDPAGLPGNPSTAVVPPWAAPGGPVEPAVDHAARGFAGAAPVTGQPPAPRRSADQSGHPFGEMPLRPLTAGEILGGASGIFRRHPRSVLGIAALLVTLQEVLAAAIQLLTADIPTSIDLTAGAQLNLSGGLGALIGLLVSTVVGAVLTGMIVVLTAEDTLGRGLGLGEVWQRVAPRLVALTGLALMVGVLAVLGLFLLLIPGLILWSAWALATPALLLERLGPVRAMRRSWQLAWPDLLRVFAIRFVGVLLSLVILYAIATPFLVIGALIDNSNTGSGDSAAVWALVFTLIGSILGGIIARPFNAGVVALLYVDRRMRAEGLDVALQLQQRRRTPPVATGQPSRADLPALTDLGPRWAGPAPVGGGLPPAAGAP